MLSLSVWKRGLREASVWRVMHRPDAPQKQDESIRTFSPISPQQIAMCQGGSATDGNSRLLMQSRCECTRMYVK